ncbi:MAG: hypothetical protein V5A57_00020 [Candidatus Paceibacterota bacterium]
MYRRKRAIVAMILVILLAAGLFSSTEAQRKPGEIKVSLELNHAAVNKVVRIDFQVDGRCESITTIVRYDSTKLTYKGYKDFWRKYTSVSVIKPGVLRIKAQTQYPVPRRSQAMQLRFIPRRSGNFKLRLGETQGTYQGRRLDIALKRHGEICALHCNFCN